MDVFYLISTGTIYFVLDMGSDQEVTEFASPVNTTGIFTSV